MITYNEGLSGDYMNVKTERSLDFYTVEQKILFGRRGYSYIRNEYLMKGKFLVEHTYFQRDKVST